MTSSSSDERAARGLQPSPAAQLARVLDPEGVRGPLGCFRAGIGYGSGRSAPVILIPLIPLLFAGAVHDRLSRGRIHPVSLWVPLALLSGTILRAVVLMFQSSLPRYPVVFHRRAWTTRRAAATSVDDDFVAD